MNADAPLTVNGGGYLTVNAGSTVPVNGGTIVVGPGDIVTVGPGGSAGHGGYIGPVTEPAGVIPPPTPAAPSWLSSLLAAPGLSGTSGIQPQLNVDELLDALS